MKNESFYEASVIEGLEKVSLIELQDLLGSQFRMQHSLDTWPGVIQFHYEGDPRKLLQLKTVISLFTVMYFPVPRPKALLGHQNFLALVEKLNTIQALSPKGAFKTFYLAAAGSDSRLMLRLKQELANCVGLAVSEDEGDLLVRFRHPRDRREGWEAVIRMAPRPLCSRTWRVCDYKGALNAAVAHAMIFLSKPASNDIFLNLACGSGTLLIERLSFAPVQLAIGCDTCSNAIQYAHQNIANSGYQSSIQAYPWDARFLPLSNESIDVLCADLPFGHDIGSHKENEILYPQLLSEAARVAKQNARFVLITHEVKMIKSFLDGSTDWIVDRVLPISLKGLHPRIYVLKPRKCRSA